MISPLAYVDPEARIGQNVRIHPFAYVEGDVVIGDNCTVMPYASVLDGTRMGNDNVVYQGAILGAAPQDFRYAGDKTLLVIGNSNIFREKVLVNRGTNMEDSTVIGDGNFLLEGVHLAHDTHVGDDCVFGNGAKTAGNCSIESHAIIGSEVILKHGCRVGSWALLKDGCRADSDIPPFVVAAHNPICYAGINAVVLSSKYGYSDKDIDDIAKAYRLIYQSGTSLENALNQIRKIIRMSPQILYILDFIEAAKTRILGEDTKEE